MVEHQPQPTQEGKFNPSTSLGTSTSLKQIRTFQGDVANALTSQKESLFSIQQREQSKKSSDDNTNQSSHGRSRKIGELTWLILGSFIFILLGSGGAWFGYQEFINKTAPPIITTPLSRLISVQGEVEINLASTTKEALFSIVMEKGTEISPNEIEHFVLRKGSGELAPLITTAEFFQKLETTAPSNLLRSFDPIFMFATYGESRFILLKLSSFENAFPGMLAWEQTMARDIGPLFLTNELLQTSTSASNFKDVTYKNKDARTIIDTGTTTKPLLLYSFFDNRILIITDRFETLKVLTERLTQELLSR